MISCYDGRRGYFAQMREIALLAGIERGIDGPIVRADR